MDTDGWMYWKGKKIFVRLNKDRFFTGNVIEVIEMPSIVFIVINDKYGKRVQFVANEIIEIKEEQS